MKITKRQLIKIIQEERRLIESPDMIVGEYEKWVKDEGHVTPAASSVIASFLHSRGIESMGLMKVLGDKFGVDPTDIQQEWDLQAKERKAAGLSTEVPHLSGGRKSSFQVAKEKELAMRESKKIRITRRQLEKLILQERSPTTMRTGMTSGGKGPMLDLPPKSRDQLQKEIRPQLDAAIKSGKTKGIPQGWIDAAAVEKIHDKDPKFSLYTPEDRGGPTDEDLMALQKALNPTIFGKFKKMFGFKESVGAQQTMKVTKSQLARIIKEEKAKILRESALDDPGGVPIAIGELIMKLEMILGLVSKTDGYITAAAKGDTTQVDMAFEANGDVEYHLQQLLGELKGL